MGQLIEVDFVHGEILRGVEDFDVDVESMLADYHECIRDGSVDFNAPLLEEGFSALHEAVFGAR